MEFLVIYIFYFSLLYFDFKLFVLFSFLKKGKMFYLSIFTRYRFPLVWTALLWLTYINYSYAEYHENLWVVGLEYVVMLGWMIWELWSQWEIDG